MGFVDNQFSSTSNKRDFAVISKLSGQTRPGTEGRRRFPISFSGFVARFRRTRRILGTRMPRPDLRQIDEALRVVSSGFPVPV